ncbi:unnamed protein product [Blepharisma stoltei]|uniref:Uncharacterized protein n=1 Tax=Blepharisma stoltei TaxID=1481888 RepID=A0AAU9K940_9CILI|nr:unnamed protein product [Blepharisma stoltei]
MDTDHIISDFCFRMHILVPNRVWSLLSFFNHDWKSAKCMINNIQSYQLLQLVGKTGNSYYSSYTLFDVRVNINGKWLQGFACGFSQEPGPSATKVINQEYPYKYSMCLSHEECGDMLMMPVWFCNKCKDCQKEFNEETRNCKWFLKNENNAIDDAYEISVGYELDYHSQDSTFIQVIFMDSPFYYESDYLGIQIVCLYLMIYIPSGIIILSLFYFIINQIRKKC